MLVAMACNEPDDELLERFHSLGLEVHKVVRNKVIGTIDAECVARLEADDDVIEVEVSSRLRKHGD